MFPKVAAPDSSLFGRLKSLRKPEVKRESIYLATVKVVAREPDEALLALREVASDGELKETILQLANLSIVQKL
jgi:hypothetical protein